MANIPLAPIKKIFTFYARFIPTYSAIGYNARKILWKPLKLDFKGQTWLVTGGSEGIGGSAARTAYENGATVICVARSAEKMAAFQASLQGPGRFISEVVDCSLQSDIWALVDRLQARGTRIDVLVNNVGIQKHAQVITAEGVETSFATNILGHYLLTRELLDRKLLSENSCVIEVSSGGMYYQAMKCADLNITGEGYVGNRAYGLAKRAQMVLAGYLREKYAGTQRSFYAMHPGWVNTASVNRSMPRFVAIMRSVLRVHAQGADTIVWLADTRPKQKAREAMWFDRKERTAHLFAHTPKSTETAADVVATLESYIVPRAAPVPAEPLLVHA